MTPFQLLVLQALYYILKSVLLSQGAYDVKAGAMLAELRAKGFTEPVPPAVVNLSIDAYMRRSGE